jgi:uracil-DNA glycosylase family 4
VQLSKPQIDPFAYTSGPRDAQVILVGEAWGEAESREHRPFVGHAGKELDRILFDAGLTRSQILCTNVVDGRPDRNDFTQFLHPTSVRKVCQPFRGTYAKDVLIGGVGKLHSLIDAVKPKLIIGAGNWPLWALTSHAECKTVKGFKLPSGIMTHRGSQTYTDEINGTKYPYLPIIHPAAILRQWGLRYITAHDLRARARRFISGKRNWEAPSYDFLPNPSFAQARDYLRSLRDRLHHGRLELCCDIETWKRKFISVVGLADEKFAICLGFFYFLEGKMIHVFTAAEEHELVSLIREILTHPNIFIINQNYAYDFQFLERWYSIRTPVSFDTMLGQHLVFPGTPKSLEYIASLYCDHYTYWKDESQDWDTEEGHEDMWLYNCKDTRHTFDASRVLRDVIHRQGLDELYNDQIKQWKLASGMYLRGVRWDRSRAERMRVELVSEASRLANFMMASMPEDLQYAPSGKPWFDSNTQQQYIFYDRLGIPPILHKKTKQPTLDKESVETLKQRAPWLGGLFDALKLYRRIGVFNNNFLSSRTGWDGRMHSSFNVGGTSTYRWSSSRNGFEEGLNLQNLPKADEEE